ncbi:matrix metalloproteinase-24-like isoform X2 [Amphiura filiformis]|uniref:matrix metalloproteinase-24-like isoform X2 n=1 Tax=Amphiura filiformis TaxID=82378 RepID=UPI003B21E60A
MCDLAIMKRTIFYILIVVTCIVNIETAPNEPAELNSGLDYLQTYGFLPEANPEAGTIFSREEFENGIKNFQSFYGLPETGQFDGETRRLMSLPRCGLKDVLAPNEMRYRRYAFTGTRWEKNDLTYRIASYTPDISEADVEDAIRNALQVWSEVTPLYFRRVDGLADIEVKFSHYMHGDGYPFDGPGGTLAHAFFPGEGIGGDAHFDDDEYYTAHQDDGTNLFLVAAHEFGHSLGLGHSSDLSSLMAPFYQGYIPDFQLPYDDRLGIQLLYGNPGYPQPAFPTRPAKPAFPDGATPSSDDPACTTSYTAVTRVRGELMLFRGNGFWRIITPGDPLPGYPIDIDKFWQELPSKIDTTYERIDGKIMFFKESHYWQYEGIRKDPGFPKLISELGLPDNLDAALPWGYTGKTYFFKGDQYYRYDEYDRKVDPGYPKLIKKNWKGVPVNVSAAFRFNNGTTWDTYFLKNRKYWRFDETHGRVDKGYPRIFDVDWMGCKLASGIMERRKNDVIPADAAYSSSDKSGAGPMLTFNPFTYSICLFLLSITRILTRL